MDRRTECPLADAKGTLAARFAVEWSRVECESDNTQRVNAMRWMVLVIVGGLFPSLCRSQTYEVIQPSGERTAIIEVQPDSMRIRDRTAGRLLYVRDLRFDSLDGRYAGYFHPDLNRVLRFPRSGFGDMWMADLDDLSPHFQPMTGTLRPLASNANHPLNLNHGYFPGGFGPTPYQFHGPMVPVWGAGISTSIGLPPPVFPGIPPAPILRQPQSVLVDSKIVPGAPLAPVTLGLRNGSPSDLVVTIVNLQDGSDTEQIKIRSGEVVRHPFSRRAGAERIDTFRVITETGDVLTRQNSIALPPEALYEIVVHQWQIQSIAIDRTGKSPNVIEDVHYQGKGLGRFPLPAGAELQPTVIDVYRAAINQGNPATVAPITTR